LPLPKTRAKVERKKVRKRALVALVILLITASVIAGFAWYGLSNRALVEYTFGRTRDLRRDYRLFAFSRYQPGTIDITQILIRNTGQSDITVIVTLHALNAVVSAGYYGPFSDMANVQLQLPVASGYRVVTFYLTLPVQVPTFSIRIDVNRVLDFSSFTSLAEASFASIQPTPPTLLTYSDMGESPAHYQLIQQS
jgi:hypothetical protein